MSKAFSSLFFTYPLIGFMLGAQWHLLARGLEKALTVLGWIAIFSVMIYLAFKIYKNRRYGPPAKRLAAPNCEGLEVGCSEVSRP